MQDIKKSKKNLLMLFTGRCRQSGWIYTKDRGKRKKVTGAYQKIEDGVTGTYKKIENGVVGTYQKIEDAFVDRFLEEKR